MFERLKKLVEEIKENTNISAEDKKRKNESDK